MPARLNSDYSLEMGFWGSLDSANAGRLSLSKLLLLQGCLFWRLLWRWGDWNKIRKVKCTTNLAIIMIQRFSWSNSPHIVNFQSAEKVILTIFTSVLIAYLKEHILGSLTPLFYKCYFVSLTFEIYLLLHCPGINSVLRFGSSAYLVRSGLKYFEIIHFILEFSLYFLGPKLGN